MCETEYEALAEIVWDSSSPSPISGLYSRVFLYGSRSGPVQECCSEDNTEEEVHVNPEPKLVNDSVKDDPNQCCASNTDYISTDEHDSLKENQAHPPFSAAQAIPLAATVTSSTTNSTSHGLQSSDSGADLSESSQLLIENEWRRFWSENGERLIWKSWIDKYSDYINPDYLSLEPEPEAAHLEYRPARKAFASKPAKAKEKLTFDFEVVQKNQMLVRNLSGSESLEKLNGALAESEGWNPLSPLSLEMDAEAERLINSSRCGSAAGSAAKTLATTDSMTNVTTMTVSSFGMSNSSQSPVLLSASSSLESTSEMASSSEEAAATEQDGQWQELWKQHYDQQYSEQYSRFLKLYSGLEEAGKDLGELQVNEEEVEEEIEEEDGEEAEMMQAFGLPTSFVRHRRMKRFREECYVEDSTESATEGQERSSCSLGQIRSALDLMGFSFSPGSQSIIPQGEYQVNYKKRNIRQQNRLLKLTRPIHIRFDDDGNVVSETTVKQDEDINTNLYTEEDNHGNDESSSCEENLDVNAAGDNQEAINATAEDAEAEAEAAASSGGVPKAKKKKKNKKKCLLPDGVKKYWYRRFSLFSRFDEGIKLDTESWFSATPEKVAAHISLRCKCDVIIDAFCGAGGNTIQFAQHCSKVIAIDIDPEKVALARHNAGVYGVLDSIEFIVGDFFALCGNLKGDVVFLSPPWGGPGYAKCSSYDLEKMLLPKPATYLMEMSRKVTDNIALYVPKNSDVLQLSMLAGEGNSVEIEQSFLRNKLVALTAYFGELAKPESNQ